MPKLPIAAQLYTVRDLMAKDVQGTLRAVAALGYDGVEFAGLYNTPVAELRALLDELGLKVCSSHVPLAELENNLDQAIANYRALGCGIIVVPWLDPSLRADYAGLAARLGPIAERVHAAGMRLAYHNHDFELREEHGTTGLAQLRAAVPPELMGFELDCGWVHKAGQNPLALARELAGRLPLLHIKDVDANGNWIEVGSGVVGYGPVIDAAPSLGVEWLIVELDVCPRPPLESLGISLNWLREYQG
jgi:sugar phosphate isomerase/epimerase